MSNQTPNLLVVPNSGTKPRASQLRDCLPSNDGETEQSSSDCYPHRARMSPSYWTVGRRARYRRAINAHISHQPMPRLFDPYGLTSCYRILILTYTVQDRTGRRFLPHPLGYE